MKGCLPALLLLVCSLASAQEGFLSEFRDVYFIGGVPLDREVNKNTMDIKFQLSVKIKPIPMKNDWRCYIAYTQISVWNILGKSSPFKDNSYMPGFYFEKKYDKGDILLLGIEHRSNGRPYYGNPVSDGTFDDYSRGMNYFYASWSKPFGNSLFGIEAKAGVGAGVECYPEEQKLFTVDLFLYYLGFVTLNYNYDYNRFHANASVTPIVNKSVANITVGAAYRLFRNVPLSFFTQFHYGYDEALADCVRNTKPPVNLRFGLILK